MSRKQRRAHLQGNIDRAQRSKMAFGGMSEEAYNARYAADVRHFAKEDNALSKLMPVNFEVVPEQTTPVIEVSDGDIAFQGRWRELLPKFEDLTRDERSMSGPFCEALSSIFFSGGKLSDHGIYPKPGYDLSKIMRYIRATLPDWGGRSTSIRSVASRTTLRSGANLEERQSDEFWRLCFYGSLRSLARW